jgi:hypothetical protein
MSSSPCVLSSLTEKKGRKRGQEPYPAINVRPRTSRKRFLTPFSPLRKSSWTGKDAEDARSIQEELGYFANMKVSRVHEDEYPEAGGGRGQ